MKKSLLAIALCTCLYAQAQETQPVQDATPAKESVLFKHFGVATSIGSNGFGIDLGTTLTPTVEMRVGWDAMSRFTTTTHLYTNELSNTGMALLENEGTKIDFDARSNMKTGKVLIDIFTNTKTDFHFTVGLFFASNAKVAQATNVSHVETMQGVYEWNKQFPQEKIGVEVGPYFLEPDASGHMHAAFSVKRVQPYAGIGWGHAVPKKNRLAVGIEFGLKYWGKPDIYCNDVLVPESSMNGSNHKVLKTLSNLYVWPVVNLRVACRLF